LISDQELTLNTTIIELALLANFNSAPLPAQTIQPEPPAVVQTQEVQPVEYTGVEGDNLSKIAEKTNSPWLRIWQKNTALTDPDVIKVGDKLIIPTPEEVLADRPLPVIVEAPQVNRFTASTNPSTRGSSSGNTYTYGYCTWYVKNRRPDLPNNLGNADTWTIRARQQGIGTGTTPVAGAVGQLGMHVVYVESVNGDMMTISEMNREGWNVESSRTIAWSGWNFIY
jgi:surface antigen